MKIEFHNDSRERALAAAEEINMNYLQGREIRIRGRLVRTFPGAQPARVWGTGTLKVDTVGRRPGTLGTTTITPGRMAVIRIGAL